MEPVTIHEAPCIRLMRLFLPCLLLRVDYFGDRVVKHTSLIERINKAVNFQLAKSGMKD